MNKRFVDLVPGDKFTVDSDSLHPVTGVVVMAPVESKVEKRLLRKPKTYYRARCIELHPLHGPVEWNPEFLADYLVVIES